jgi:anti-anti-sigma regulatory factor
MKAGVELFASDRLTIHSVSTDKRYTLNWSGECDFRNPSEALGPTLRGVLPELRERRLVLDFRGLTFMNSSSVSPILMFIKAACSRGIWVHLVYNVNLSWQRTTASSMRALGHSLRQLTVELQGAQEAPESDGSTD